MTNVAGHGRHAVGLSPLRRRLQRRWAADIYVGSMRDRDASRLRGQRVFCGRQRLGCNFTVTTNVAGRTASSLRRLQPRCWRLQPRRQVRHSGGMRTERRASTRQCGLAKGDGTFTVATGSVSAPPLRRSGLRLGGRLQRRWTLPIHGIGLQELDLALIFGYQRRWHWPSQRLAPSYGSQYPGWNDCSR